MNTGENTEALRKITDLTRKCSIIIVGLHFYPMARVFKRNIDYIPATWCCIVAVFAIVFSLKDTLPDRIIIAFVGTGLALATSFYGIFIIYTGRQFIGSRQEAGTKYQ